MTIRVGVIGTGRRLASLCATIAASEEVAGQFVFAGLCDSNPERIAAFRGHVPLAADTPAFDDHRAMLKQTETDLILVGTPNYLHREHAVAAMEAGKHVFCEKPLATTLDDLQAIYETHRRTGRLFMTGFVLRYTPLFARLREVLDSGSLGDIVSVESNETLEFCHGAWLLVHPWRRHSRYSGGHLLEKCSHDIDLLNYVAGGRAARVASFGGRGFFLPRNAHRIAEIGTAPDGRKPYHDGEFDVSAFDTDGDVADNQVLIIEYDNGVHACHHTNRNAGLPERRMHVFGSEAGLRMDFRTNELEWARIGFDGERHHVNVDSTGGHGGGDVGIARQLIHSVTTGEAPAAGCDEGFRSGVTALAAEKARRINQVVELAPIWKRFGVSLRENGAGS